MSVLAARGVVTFLLVWASFGSMAAGSSDDAVEWLGRMAEAVRHENYKGIFTYTRGTTFETVRIVHRGDENVETERLFNLNGDIREVYRHGDEILCFVPAGNVASDCSVRIGPFTPAFPERVIATQNMYRLSMHKEDRIAGRPAVTLLISPKRDDRYGYRIWLDKETGLMLQSHKVERGRIREIFQFTMLEIGNAIDDIDLASSIQGDTVSHPLTFDFVESREEPRLRVSWLPDGFRQVRRSGDRLHFTDGVATFSVFVDRSKQGSLPDMTTRVGGTVVISRRLNQAGPQITVVGDVPMKTARRVADSVEPLIY